MQGAKSANLHKRNLCKETEYIRNARARQLRLDEIGGKLERAKHKSIRTSNHQKVKVLNELTSIHRVFEPLHVIKEDQERLIEDQIARKQNQTENAGRCASDTTAAFVKQPRILRRAQTQSVTSQATQVNTDQEKILPNSNPKRSQVNGKRRALLRPRSNSWSPQSPNSEPERTRYAFQSKREYMAKLRTAAVEPRVSDSMSSLTLGYSAFKRVLKNKRRPERSFVNSRFRSISLDETELTVIPELVEGSDTGVQGTFYTQQRSSPLVKEDKKQKLGIIEGISAPVGQQQHSSIFSWPLGELSRTQVILRQKDKTLEQEDLNETKKNSEEEKIGTLDKNPKQKNRFSQNRHIRFIGASKLLRPLGTGCFSESFQAVSNGKN